MKINNNFTKRIMAILLSLVIVMGAFPITTFAATSVGTSVADTPTVEGWKNWFTDDSNRYSGAVYIDKSVYTASDIENSYFAPVKDKLSFGTDNFGNENFLVSLSAIGSNTEILGYSVTPTDTVFVLDLSSSMTEDNTEAMVDSTNRAIETLLSLNYHNRIGVVLYSGASTTGSNATANSATVLLQLDRYTTTVTETVRENGQNVEHDVFLEFEDGEISLAARYSGYGNNRRQNKGVSKEGETGYINALKAVGGGTYIQNGLYKAYNLFPSGDDTVIEDGKLQAGTQRKPIVVLMSDGAPTSGTVNYNNVGTANTGNGSSSSATNPMGFLTQLTASWVKANLKAKYNDTEPMFYTLGLGTSNNAVATGVLNPSSTANGANGYWETFLNNGSVSVSLPSSATAQVGSKTIRKADNSVLVKDYVDKYWSANNAADMTKAFSEIVDEIVIQSRYYATLVTSGLHEHDGYISFVDEIGYGMEVKQMEGIHIGGDTLVTGDMFAESMFNGEIRDAQTGVYTTLGAELISALKTRFDISENAALTLLNTAISNKDIDYNATAGTFSNFVRWYADENNDYLAPYNAVTRAIPTGAKYLVKSYIYLGDVKQNHIETDMLYTLIRVREDLENGIQIVDANLPAALLPMITYTVSVEGDTLSNESLISMTNNIDEKEPACLLYEVGLRSDITPYNVVEKMSLGGTNAYHRNDDGTYYFYTNRWKKDATTPFTIPAKEDLPTGIYNHGLVGSTEAHFVPSIENERYYYTTNTAVLTKNGEDYVAYTGNTAPSGTGYYHEYTHIKIENNVPRIHSHYNPISEKAILEADPSGSGWVIPAGTPKRYFGEAVFEGTGYDYGKKADETLTETLDWYNYPASVHEAQGSAAGYHVFAYLGNNGRVTVAPGEGIKLTKTVSQKVDGATDSFEFEIALSEDQSDLRYRLEEANGNVNNGTVSTVNKIIPFTLSDGDVLYIIDIDKDVTYTVTEKYNRHYIGSSSNNQGIIEEHTINSVDFVNSPRGFGSLLVEKEVMHPFGDTDIPTALSAKEFDITVTFEGASEDLGNIKNNKNISGNNGVYNFKLKDDEDILFTDIPEGISYTVEENNNPDGFDMDTTLSNGLTGSIAKDTQSLAKIVNNYSFTKVSDYEITIGGTKTVLPDERWTDEEFTVELRHIDAQTGAVTKIGDNKTVSKTSRDYSFTLNESNFELDRLGTYYFQVIEIEPQSPVTDMAYDKTVGWFGIIVTDNNIDGELEIGDVFTRETDVDIDDLSDGDGNTYAVDKDFTNVFEAANIEIPVKKRIVKENTDIDASISKANYMFGIYDDNDTLLHTVLTNADGEAKFTFAVTADDYATEKLFTVKELLPDIQNAVVGVTYNLDTAYKVGIVWKNNAPSVTVYENGQAVNTTPTFVNTYDQDIAITPITLSGTKTLNGGELRDRDNFTIEIYNTDADFITTGHSAVFSKAVSKSDSSFTFTPSFDTTGTKYFVVKEVNGGTVQNGIAYDNTVYHITAHVNKKFDGNKAVLEVRSYTVHKLGDQNPVDQDNLNFNNIYSINDTEEITLKAKKTLNGRTMLSGEFSFGLYENGNLIETVKNDIDGSLTFTALTFTKPESHTYTVKEIIPTDKYGVDYDNTAYTVEVNITDNGIGELDKEVTVNQNTYTDSSIVFNNSYSAEETSVTLSGTKTLNGRPDGIKDGEFTFELYKTDSSFVVPENALPVSTKTNNKVTDNTGNYQFDLTYLDGDEGIYYYVLTEKIPAEQSEKKGVNFDTREYHITVMVLDNGKGALIATVANIICAGMNGSFENDALDFINDYNPAPATYTISGKKDYNLDIEADMFSFELSNSEGSIETVKNNADGEYTFKEVELGSSGVHTFTVKEINGGSTIKGIKYDDAVFTVKITVEDNNEGAFEITDVEYLKDGQSANEILFQNKYSADATDAVKITATKGLEGRKLEDKEFSFSLYEADGDGNRKGDAISKTQNDADGNVIFSKELIFDKEGTYKYVVVENNSGTDRVTFDETVYVTTIVVKDDGEGKLYVDSITYTADGKDVEKIEFKNIYTPEEPKTPEEPQVPEEPKTADEPQEPIPSTTVPAPPTNTSPQTGDNFNINLWLAILFISSSGFFGISFLRKRYKLK